MSDEIVSTINVNMATCRCCGKLVERIEYRGRYYNLNRQRWNGRMCPQCNIDSTRSNMQKIRATRNNDVNDDVNSEWNDLCR